MESTTIPREIPTLDQASIAELFERQKVKALQLALTGCRERKAKLKKLMDWMDAHQEEIQQEIYKDFRKSPTEFYISEHLVVRGEIKYTMNHLRRWMRRKKVSTPIVYLGTQSYIHYEPKGVCLIISPWNYPFSLAIKPLISCIAAGNTAILKPSEMTPYASGLIKQMIEEIFEPDEVTVVEGGVDISQRLLSLPFDHIFFTGSPRVGKIVMEAASKHLTSVTLELGGKSPCIIDPSANIRQSAERIAWGKWLNNGQTCIAPDYLLVHESVKDSLIDEIEKAVNKMYNPEGAGFDQSQDYDRMVNEKHFHRLRDLMDQTLREGGHLAFGGEVDISQNYIAPTVIFNVSKDMGIMEEEIFGPILPVITYRDQEEVLEVIHHLPKPLAMYIFAKDRTFKDFFLNRTSAGGTVINETLIHFGHHALPFGGVNNSGIGKSGGKYGFIEFSNQRGVIEQRWGTIKPFYPPYTDRVKKLVKLVERFF